MWIDDQVLARYREPVALEFFVPDKTTVVLGSGNDVSTEVNETYCLEAGIPVLKRYGGGGTVVLYPGCVVVSIGAWVRDAFNNSRYFRGLNHAVIQSLAATWPALSHLDQSGISDIVSRDQKVGGTSLFRSRQYLLYQASILVELDRPLIAKCLKHPTKEPDYRRGRKHESFLTSLCELEPAITSAEMVKQTLEISLAEHIVAEFTSELVLPQETQMKSLEERLARAAAGT